MAAAIPKPQLNPKDVESFSAYLKSSTRILALLGAGLSASSGLPTFRGAGGLWRTHDATSLATPHAFQQDPGLVWQFYSYRRHMALNAQPNRAHFALAELARRKPDFVTLSQNVDGLSPRAGHPSSQLYLLHGSLFDVKCTSFDCDHVEHDNFKDPIVPALAIPVEGHDPTSSEAREAVSDALQANRTHGKELDIADAKVKIPSLKVEELPHCPKCKEGLMRPGVVWFGEPLPEDDLDAIEDWINESKKIDLMLVIGTSAKVFPAAAYAERARSKGARIAVVNLDSEDAAQVRLSKKDWFFQGDAAQVIPIILETVIGNNW